MPGTSTPLAADFQVNVDEGTIGDNDKTPSIARLGSGGFVVVWQETGDPAIQAQIYDAEGQKVGGAIDVNTTTYGGQYYPTVMHRAGGGFIVTWSDTSAIYPDTGWSIRAQMFGADGGKVGEEFIVNTTLAADQLLSVITPLADGGFVISWRNDPEGPGAANWETRAQIFDASGARTGGEFTVGPADAWLAPSASGGFVSVHIETVGEFSDKRYYIDLRYHDETGAQSGADRRIVGLTPGPFRRRRSSPSPAAAMRWCGVPPMRAATAPAAASSGSRSIPGASPRRAPFP